MKSLKYIGMDVHTATISVAVLDVAGKLIMESVIETKSSTILELMHGLRGDLHVTFEEGTWAAWLYELLKLHVAKIVVCDPRRNALLKEGHKSDRIDARKLAELFERALCDADAYRIKEAFDAAAVEVRGESEESERTVAGPRSSIPKPESCSRI